VGERLAEGLYILQEVLDRFGERQRIIFIETGNLESGFIGFEF